MSQYDNNMTGALFANKDRKSDKHPNARGSCEIDGKEYWVSAWTKTSKNGERYQSLAFTAKEEQTDKPAPAAGGNDFDDEIPFSQHERGLWA